MHKFIEASAGAAFALAMVAGFSGCGSGNEGAAAFAARAMAAGSVSGTNSTVSACDGVRRHIRQVVAKQFGYDAMIEQMKRVSREISADDREDLKRFASAIDTLGLNPDLQSQAVQLTQGIYAAAMDRAGIVRGKSEHHEDIHRFIMADPSGTDPLSDGYSEVLYSAPIATTAPEVGAITNAYLGVTADQQSYEFILLRTKTVSAGPNNGFSSTGEYITMSQYVESQLPSYCAKVGSALPPAKINTVAAAN